MEEEQRRGAQSGKAGEKFLSVDAMIALLDHRS